MVLRRETKIVWRIVIVILRTKHVKFIPGPTFFPNDKSVLVRTNVKNCDFGLNNRKERKH